MFITPSFKKSLIVEQFQGNYLKYESASVLKLSQMPFAYCLWYSESILL